MNSHWQTNLGGAISILGTTLLGAGLVPQLAGIHSNTLLVITIAGLVLSGIGKGVAFLFAADAKTVNNIAAAVDKINAQGADSSAPPSKTAAPFSATPPTT